ncbi:TPA: hypothetical protein RMI67_006582, partial [Bacillus cereus]|nr:hypothetical protein [Bacillus cereus]
HPFDFTKKDFQTETFQLSSSWLKNHQNQFQYYTKHLIHSSTLSKFKNYLNQKYINLLSLKKSTKLIEFSSFQHPNTILKIHRIDYCLQQLSPEYYKSNDIESFQSENYISYFFKNIVFMLDHMNPSGAILLTEDSSSNSPVLYKNNQIILQTQISTGWKNEKFLNHLYQKYFSLSSFSFQSLDPVFHNLLYGFGLKWYKQMKSYTSLNTSILTDIYQIESILFQEIFNITFEQEKDYYATLFQIMYSPLFMYIALSFSQHIKAITKSYTSLTTGIDYIQNCMKKY